jgi:hypothetical protein
MAASVTATAPVSSVRVSDGGGAVRAQAVSSATERVQQLYNLSDNDVQNILRIIQTETTNVFGGGSSVAEAAAAPPAPVSTRVRVADNIVISGSSPLQVQAQAETLANDSQPVATPVSNRNARPSPQQRFAEMREAARREAEGKVETQPAGGEDETKRDE